MRLRSVAIATLVALATGCTVGASAAQSVPRVIELGDNSSLRQSVTALQPGDSVMWSNHGDVVRRVEITGRRMVEVPPGEEAVTTFSHAGKWIALDPDRGEVVAVIEVGNTG